MFFAFLHGCPAAAMPARPYSPAINASIWNAFIAVAGLLKTCAAQRLPGSKNKWISRTKFEDSPSDWCPGKQKRTRTTLWHRPCDLAFKVRAPEQSQIRAPAGAQASATPAWLRCDLATTGRKDIWISIRAISVHETDDLLYDTQAGTAQCHHDHLTVSNCKTIGMFESSQGTCQIKALSKALVKALARRSEKIPYIISSVDWARRFWATAMPAHPSCALATKSIWAAFIHVVPILR